MLTDEDIERAWLGDQTVAPRGGRITGFSRLASFARAIEALTREQTIERYARLERAVSAYIDNYLLDELDEPEYCVCGQEQHDRLKELFAARDAIRALGSKT